MKLFAWQKRLRLSHIRRSILVVLVVSAAVWILPGRARATAPIQKFHARVEQRTAEELARRDFMSVCPPFFLRDEQGLIIDPRHGVNVQQPYSPEKTCGQCHDYQRITSGYHFQQGKDEKLSPKLAALYPWMRTPGQYGGRY